MVFLVHVIPSREPNTQGHQPDHWLVWVMCSYKIFLHLIIAVHPLGDTSLFLQHRFRSILCQA